MIDEIKTLIDLAKKLEGLVRNVLPPNTYDMQFTLSTGVRADCVLRLPAPTGMVAVEFKISAGELPPHV